MTDDNISLAVWGAPMPAVAGERFTVKAGAKSAAGKALAGRRIEICDAAGAVVASAPLGGTPLEGTQALYWAELNVPAPAQSQVTEYSVRLAPEPGQSAEIAVPTRFSIVTTAKPEHKLAVKVTERDTKEALGGVEIRLGAFHGRTDKSGQAELRVCTGQYQLQLWRTAHDAPAQTIKIDGDVSIELTMVHVPEDHPDARWVR